AMERGADLALGLRELAGDMPVIRRLANGVASAWATWLAGQPGGDSPCGDRLYGRRLLERTPITPGRYGGGSDVVLRAAPLGCRIEQVPIPTVYGTEVSQMRTARDVPRILSVLARLTLERVAPPPEMRRAARTGAAS